MRCGMNGEKSSVSIGVFDGRRANGAGLVCYHVSRVSLESIDAS